MRTIPVVGHQQIMNIGREMPLNGNLATYNCVAIT